MDFLLGLLLDLFGLALFEGLWELLRLLGRGLLALVAPDRPPAGPHPLAVCVGAVVAGALMGALGAHLVPARVAPAGAGVVAAWIVLPLAGGLVGTGLDLLRRRERRDPAVDFLAGLLFGLAWLGARAAARAAGA